MMVERASRPAAPQERRITKDELAKLGREDADHMAEILAKLIEEDGLVIEQAKVEVFSVWHAVQIHAAEARLREAGLLRSEVTTWRRACRAQLNAKIAEMARSYQRVH
ncbi:hypothetical protein KQX62_12045 [Rhodopseudomonas palustris]|uniref:Uncharacterized protein n=1 Tax=Rhodopseudomonas palustris TaxID=1076 RepID=A0AAX3DRL2_RHOPL|nr:hypothetical protein [Rhodopseudomonas palustris]UYO37490.1 hypothetical protein KQX62_12045 [Rhodopseudomonas palustris]